MYLHIGESELYASTLLGKIVSPAIGQYSSTDRLHIFVLSQI